MTRRRYANLYERLVANTELAVPDNHNSCWVWKGTKRRGYPAIAIRVKGKRTPRTVAAHRLMLEVFHGILFPFDEAGHTCHNSMCVNPMHLEVQTQAHNYNDRRGCAHVDIDKSWLPVLFPVADELIESEAIPMNEEFHELA